MVRCLECMAGFVQYACIIGIYCDILQHTAAHCNALHHNAAVGCSSIERECVMW